MKSASEAARTTTIHLQLSTTIPAKDKVKHLLSYLLRMRFPQEMHSLLDSDQLGRHRVLEELDVRLRLRYTEDNIIGTLRIG